MNSQSAWNFFVFESVADDEHSFFACSVEAFRNLADASLGVVSISRPVFELITDGVALSWHPV